jgi:hypothetical protein
MSVITNAVKKMAKKLGWKELLWHVFVFAAGTYLIGSLIYGMIYEPEITRLWLGYRLRFILIPMQIGMHCYPKIMADEFR